MHKNGNYNYAHNSTLSCHYRNNWSKCFTPQAFLKLQCKSKTSQAHTKHSSRRQSPDAVSSSQDFWYRSLLNSHDSFTKKKKLFVMTGKEKGRWKSICRWKKPASDQDAVEEQTAVSLWKWPGALLFCFLCVASDHRLHQKHLLPVFEDNGD